MSRRLDSNHFILFWLTLRQSPFATDMRASWQDKKAPGCMPCCFLFKYLQCSRTYIAAIHYNSNADRATKKDEGNDKYRLKSSKATKGWLVVPVKEHASYGNECASTNTCYMPSPVLQTTLENWLRASWRTLKSTQHTKKLKLHLNEGVISACAPPLEISQTCWMLSSSTSQDIRSRKKVGSG